MKLISNDIKIRNNGAENNHAPTNEEAEEKIEEENESVIDNENGIGIITGNNRNDSGEMA